MRVALVNLTRGGLSFGYQKYLQELVPLLQRHIKDLVIFVPPKFTSLLGDTPCQPCADTMAGRRALRATLAKLSPDVIFFPSLRGLTVGRIPTVCMIRNMESLARHFWGNCWTEEFKNLGRYYSARMACRQATRVVAVSEYVKDFLTEKWQVPPGKIGVVYHGVNEPADPAGLPVPKGIAPDWAGRFLFTAGAIRPARGLEDIIRVLPLLAAQGLQRPLVIAGGTTSAGLPYYRQMQKLSKQLGVDDLIFWAGQLTPAEMSWCYHHCEVFIMTSRVEACPNVALEAMRHGCSGVVAHNPPLPEFFQETCLYYTPRRAASLAEAVATALNRAAPETQRLQDLARARGREFTWQRTAELTVRELEKAAGSLR
jgi:glycosyltransferase involved in cell wall biosynthesis